MKILLFNDNPVVRKLVALSAQKTKDDLSVVWSTDEIEESAYDLLIIDDALYSDEIFESLKEKIVVKSTLFMATRGKAVPSGFDNVINKPFLPTDLVDMLVQIEKKAVDVSDQKSDKKEENIAQEPVYAINLEDSLPESTEHEEDAFGTDILEETEEDFDFGDLEDFDEKLPETAILDQEEVQEVQGLLEDTEEENIGMEEDILSEDMGSLSVPEEERGVPIELEDDLSFNDELMTDENMDDILNFDDEEKENEVNIQEEIEDREFLNEDEFKDIELSAPADEGVELQEDDELLSLGEEIGSDEETEFGDLDVSSLMDDEELGDLESKIEDAVSGLESEELEKELETGDLELDFDEEMMDELMPMEFDSSIESEASDSEGFDELDMLDERELKMAVGEEIEDTEPVISVAKGDMSLAAETFDEVMKEVPVFDESVEEIHESAPATHAEGVEALQALLQALSNKDVAKSLKGMNISININFGNGA